MKSDRGFISGFIGVAIHMTIQHILQHIYIANRCKNELEELKDLVMSIELTIMHIQQNRVAFKANKEKDTASSVNANEEIDTASSVNANEEKETASAVNEWLNQLDVLLLRASEIVQQCSIPKSHFNFSGCQTKKKISRLILKIRAHLKRSPLLARISEGQVGDSQKVREGQVRDTHKVLQGVGQVQHSVEALASSATTSPAARKDLIVGQNQAFQSLQKLVIDDVEAMSIDMLGNAGSGKTLILLTLFNSQEVRNHFRDGLLLWLTVSQSPSVTSLRNDLCKQIAIQKKEDLTKDIEELGEEKWLNQKLQQSSRFALFLDDVREGNAAELLQELGIEGTVRNHTESKVIVSSRNHTESKVIVSSRNHTKSKVIFSSRDPTALLKMGVADKYKEPYIVGQNEVFKSLQNLIIADGKAKNIGVFGKCGSGKTLLLSRVFKSQEVRTHFSDGLFLWLTVSQMPFTSLMNDLCKQIAIQKKTDFIKAIKEGEEKTWLNEQLQQSSRFALFLDDACERNATKLLERLGISEHSNSKVIVSYRDPNASSEMGVADEDQITILDLNQNESWQLFKHLAFPYNNGNLPSNIDEEKLEKEAKVVCEKCGGLPRALQVVGRAMAGSTHPQQCEWAQWEWAVHSLSKATQATIGGSGQPLDAQVTAGGSGQPLGAQVTAGGSGQPLGSEVTTGASAQPLGAQVTAGGSGQPLGSEVTTGASAQPLGAQVTAGGSGQPLGSEVTTGASAQPLGAQVTTGLGAQPLDACLRLSFDALGNQDFNMQLCFLHIAAAFSENKIIDAQEVIPLWMGEGLLARKVLKHVPQHILADRYLIEPMIRNTEGRPVCLRMQDPFEIGRLYLDLLAERCLIEPTARDADGRVLCFRMLKVVRDLAIAIAEDEENFYCCMGNRLEDLQKNKSLKIKRIFLSDNNSSSLPAFSSSSEMSSLLISQNRQLRKIPKKVIGSMLSLKVLDLSGTSASSLPKNMGSLKQLICLKLSGMPIKGLPKSLRDLGHLEILDLSFTEIKELPSDIHMLRSLRYLGLSGCKYLQNLPYSISSLTSLQYLYMDGCTMWKEPTRNRCSMWKEPTRNRCKRVASLQSLGDLIQLRKLALQIDWEEAIGQGTLGSMTEMDTLLLILPKMKSLPLDINNMSKLRSLSLKCSELTEMDSFKCSSLTEMENKMKNDVTNFKHLSYLKFYKCDMLKDFQHLHKLQNLRHLEIILCPEVEKFPQEFGEKEAFPLLKILSLVGLQKLEELPEIKEGAMPSLEIFNMMDCPKLKILPQTCLNLEIRRIRIRVYGCPSLGVAANRNLVQVVAMAVDTKEIIEKYLQVLQKKEDWLYGEFWCNELFLFVEGLLTFV